MMPTGANVKVVQFTLFSQSHLTFAFEITEINLCDYKSLTRIQPVPEISGPTIIKFTAT
jgi:hypothetical protein